MFPQESMLKSYLTGTQNVILFGDGVITHVMVKLSIGAGWPREDTELCRKNVQGDRGRDWSESTKDYL